MPTQEEYSPIDSHHRTSKKLRAGEVVEEEIQAELCYFWTEPLMGKKDSCTAVLKGGVGKSPSREPSSSKTPGAH